jgi:hypothetical protein
MNDAITLKICGWTCELDPWELIRWIGVQTLFRNATLRATAFYCNTEIEGRLALYSKNRFMSELSSTLLVNLLTPQGTYTFNCKHLTSIELGTELDDDLD